MKLPKGYQCAGVACGIKGSRKKDLTLIVSDCPAHAAATLTTNKVKAAPILVNQRKIKKGKAQAIIVNSGNANACTGTQGIQNAVTMTQEVSKALKIPSSLVWVASTGVIGRPLPMKEVKQGLSSCIKKLSTKNVKDAARAILTTDKFVKIAYQQGRVGRQSYSLLGIAKGAGMIMPQMSPTGHATMLAFLLTDLNISKGLLQSMLNRCVAQTFNTITVDGDTSTNDMVLLLANGKMGNKSIKVSSPLAKRFEKQLLEVCHRLALMVVADGEGATKVVKIEVKGARSSQEAEKLARTMATSLLVKTSFFGNDPNWGRLMGAAGRAGVSLNPDKVDIFYNDVCVVRKGTLTNSKAIQRAKNVARKTFFTVTFKAHRGVEQASVYTSDLGHNYVRLNSEYPT